jgi:hypothetical protein
MERRPFLKGAGVVTVVVVGGGVWRAYDQGVFSVGQGPAYEPWRDWRNGPSDGPLALVRAAILAASPHNGTSSRIMAKGMPQGHATVEATLTVAPERTVVDLVADDEGDDSLTRSGAPCTKRCERPGDPVKRAVSSPRREFSTNCVGSVEAPGPTTPEADSQNPETPSLGNPARPAQPRSADSGT